MEMDPKTTAALAFANRLMAERRFLALFHRTQLDDVAALPVGDRLQFSHYRLSASVSALAVIRAQAEQPCGR